MSPRKPLGTDPVEEELGRIVEESLNEIYIFDASTLQFCFVNRGGRENLGYTLDELKELTPVDVKPKLSRQAFEKLIRPLRDRQEKAVCFNTVHQRKNRSHYEVEVHLQMSTYHGMDVFVAIILDTTDRVKANAALLLRNRAMEALTVGVVITAATEQDQPIIYCNPAFESITGYSASEVIGHNCRFLQQDDRNQPALNVIRTAVRQGSECRALLRNYRKDGTLFWNDLTISPVFDAAHSVTHFIGIANDVTERVLAQRETKENETRLKTILDTVVDAIITIDEQGICESFNIAAESMFGYRANEVVGNDIAMLMPEPFRSEHDDYIARYVRTGEKRIIGIGREVIGKRKNGEEFPIDLAVSEVRLGEQRLFTGILRDISERKRAESEIAERQRQLTTLFANLPGAAYRCKNDRDWTMEFISDGCEDLFGYSAADFTSDQISFGRNVVHPDDRDVAWEQVQQGLKSNSPFQLSYRIRDAHGEEKWIWERASRVFADEETLIAIEGFMTDVSDLKHAQDQLVQSERLAALGEAMTRLAHESRNALQRIQVAVESARLDASEDEELCYQLSAIETAGDELNSLLDEVRNYAAPIHLDRESALLCHVWREAWQQVAKQHGKRDVTFREDGADVTCCIDRFRMVQVFRNLFENSVSACQGTLEIRIAVSKPLTRNGEYLEISVRDNGPGLSPEQKTRVFEPFFTTKAKGTGLGMAIARRIVESHGGQIYLREGDTAGAEFLIVLPCE